MEAFTVYKLFYHVSKKNKLFVKKLDDSRKLFKVDKCIFNSRYGDGFIYFSNRLFVYLEKYVNEEKMFLVKDVLTDCTIHFFLFVFGIIYFCVRG